MNPAELRAALAIALLYLARMLGLFMALPVLPLLVDEIPGATPFLIGIALGGYGLFQALLQIPLGLASDTWGRKPVIAAGLTAFILGSLVCAWAPSIHWLIIGRCLQGCGALASVLLALTTDLTRESRRTQAFAIVGVAIAASFGLSLVLGPSVMALGGLPAIFLVSALLGTLGLAALPTLLPPLPPARATQGTQAAASASAAQGAQSSASAAQANLASEMPNPQSAGSATRASLKTAAADPRLWRLNLSVFFLHFQFIAAFLLIPVLLEAAGLPAAQHGLHYLWLLVLAFILALPGVWLNDRLRDSRPLLAATVLLLTLCLSALAATPAYPWLLAAALGFLAAFCLLEILLPAAVSKLASPAGRGAAMGFYTSSQFAGIFAGGLVGGYLATAASPILSLAVHAALATLWLAALLRK